MPRPVGHPPSSASPTTAVSTDGPSLEAFLVARGPLLRTETALCLVCWATVCGGAAHVGVGEVRVLPDREAVGAVRGLGRAARAPRAVARGSWERFG